MRHGLVVFACCLVAISAEAADISDPTRFMFVGDRNDNIIDVVSLDDAEVVHRINTSIHPDHVVATPFAPILVYTDTKARKAVFYDLRTQAEVVTLDLPLTPRHVVLDTTGAKIGITDDQGGGFALLHAYKKSIEFSIDDFPATADVLFDPNDVDVYFSNSANGSIGMLDVNTHRIFEMPLGEGDGDGEAMQLSPPSRSLDARYIYVSNLDTGEVYSLNAYSRVIFESFNIGGVPARPYTTPQGAFLYMMDAESGRFVSVEQRGFTEFADTKFSHGADLVAVGRFDRLSLFLSSSNRYWTIFDNVTQDVAATGEFHGTPIMTLGSADGKTAFVAFADAPEIAFVDLEDRSVTYIDATNSGAGAFTVGLSNNVCH
jgi:DNA-binding beta-propeller fold protein YncE